MRERLRIDLIIYSLLLLCLTAFKSCQTDSVENCTYFPNYPNKTLVKFIICQYKCCNLEAQLAEQVCCSNFTWWTSLIIVLSIWIIISFIVSFVVFITFKRRLAKFFKRHCDCWLFSKCYSNQISEFSQSRLNRPPRVAPIVVRPPSPPPPIEMIDSVSKKIDTVDDYLPNYDSIYK